MHSWIRQGGINKALVKMVDYVVENAKDSAEKVLQLPTATVLLVQKS